MATISSMVGRAPETSCCIGKRSHIVCVVTPGFGKNVSFGIHSEVVQTLKDYTIFFHRAAGVITYLEAHDQSNGTGGFVSYIDGGVHQTSVEVEFRQVEDAVSNIEFIVEIWGFPYSNEGVHAADFRIGELTERSAWDTRYVFEPFDYDIR